jgi:hypothetical protein
VFLARPNHRLTFPPKGKFRLYANVAQPVALIHTGPGRLEYDTANSNVAELNLDAPVRGTVEFDTGFLTLNTCILTAFFGLRVSLSKIELAVAEAVLN